MSQDILFTMTGLPNVVPGMNHEVEWKAWSHLDFLWGIDADRFWWKNQIKVLIFISQIRLQLPAEQPAIL